MQQSGNKSESSNYAICRPGFFDQKETEIFLKGFTLGAQLEGFTHVAQLKGFTLGVQIEGFTLGAQLEGFTLGA